MADLIRTSDLEPGDVIRDAGFVSMSRHPIIADQFKAADQGGVKLVITVKKGAKALDVAAISHYPEEREILLHRNQAMTVIRWRPEDGILEVEVDG